MNTVQDKLSRPTGQATVLPKAVGYRPSESLRDRSRQCSRDRLAIIGHANCACYMYFEVTDIVVSVWLLLAWDTLVGFFLRYHRLKTAPPQ